MEKYKSKHFIYPLILLLLFTGSCGHQKQYFPKDLESKQVNILRFDQDFLSMKQDSIQHDINMMYHKYGDFTAFFFEGAVPDSKTIVKFEKGFKIGRALPRGPGIMRFIVKALPHQISLTNKDSTGNFLLCSAFATADNKVFSTSPATRFFENFKTSTARSTGKPRIMSHTRFSF